MAEVVDLLCHHDHHIQIQGNRTSRRLPRLDTLKISEVPVSGTADGHVTAELAIWTELADDLCQDHRENLCCSEEICLFEAESRLFLYGVSGSVASIGTLRRLCPCSACVVMSSAACRLRIRLSPPADAESLSYDVFQVSYRLSSLAIENVGSLYAEGQAGGNGCLASARCVDVAIRGRREKCVCSSPSMAASPKEALPQDAVMGSG